MALHNVVNGPWKGSAEGPKPPDNGDMEARVAALEAVIPTLATREDVLRLETKMHQELHSLSWRIIGAMITFGTLLSGVVFYIARNVH